MDIKKLQRLVVDALDDVKAQDVAVFNTIGLSDIFDRVVVASGTSNRHTRALAGSIVGKVKEAGGHVISVEGEDSGDWVLVDLGDVVVHIMQPPIRAYYNLEEMWGAKPVRMRAPISVAAKMAPSTDDEDAPTRAKRAPSAPRPRAGKGPAEAAKKSTAKKSGKPRSGSTTATSAGKKTVGKRTSGAATTARKADVRKPTTARARKKA